MTQWKGIEALAQALPTMFRKRWPFALRQDACGYIKMSEVIVRALEKRGFHLISHATYERMRRCEEAYHIQCRLREGAGSASKLDIGNRTHAPQHSLPVILGG